MEIKLLGEDKNIIEKVETGSIANELGIEPGDILISINDKKVLDIIDYKYLISDNYVLVTIQKKNGELWDFEIEKDYDEDLGIYFTNPLIDKARSCRNNCIFCFIDQLPKGMRKTLYFKDDDSRLSFLQGNFITFTNLSDEEIQRIIDYRLSNINVSVHTTNPELRVKMLNNKNAGKILDILKKFKESGIKVNCQIVLVPGINDGKELDRTLEDLASLYPSASSVAVVPVGLTKHREGLCKLSTFDKKSSKELLEYMKTKHKIFLDRLGTRFVYPSDEFYAVAEEELPAYEEYEGFPQLENGVGLMRLFLYEIEEELKKIDDNTIVNKKYIIATGTLAYKFMKDIADKVMKKIKGLDLKVVPIENNFFGTTITVSGLITGQDLISQTKIYSDYDGIIIPSSMLRDGEDVFLDDYTVLDVEKELNKKIIPSKVSGSDFIKIFKKI
ncbi:DUF512 domain-containing protein [Anaerosalibacter bizertensis]|uniref:DUF512 domain-containing protein n=1 Tax=Anaerosalibacter bizertensis TaxID=932217 RepID=A0A844FJD4_9FIRM|nr:DUF512 domain-containing protein [Anaerosalibacter bizertensis]MSS44164.1 DUF512 domain-containing protein [Anaerosalibacter bizertensis]